MAIDAVDSCESAVAFLMAPDTRGHPSVPGERPAPRLKGRSPKIHVPVARPAGHLPERDVAPVREVDVRAERRDGRPADSPTGLRGPADLGLLAGFVEHVFVAPPTNGDARQRGSLAAPRGRMTHRAGNAIIGMKSVIECDRLQSRTGAASAAHHSQADQTDRDCPERGTLHVTSCRASARR